jgi:protein-S-isoprenylcysteine O-methyltransferase Ste14
MKTMIYTVLYLLLASAVAYIFIVCLGMTGMGKALFLLVTGFALAGASAFTSAYSTWWGEKGGQITTIILRNLLGIPLLFAGYVLSWLAPSPLLFSPDRKLKVIGFVLITLGSVPFIVGHIELGWRTHMPSVKDTLVRHGLYVYVRHPIYAGGFAVFAGIALIRPTSAFVLACMLGFIWLIIQARLEEIDLLQRMPDYKDYMRQVPRRFLPRIWR